MYVYKIHRKEWTMSQIYSTSGMVTDDTEAFIEELRRGMKAKCAYCKEELDGRKANAKFCNPLCYARHTVGKYKHGEAPTHCAQCGDEIIGRRHGAKYCGVGCRILGGNQSR